ncbi:recombinase family protein [Brucella pseudogrignonensis]|uniref:recombinase family protein n=1 Tax=Brucella pseudogrignonensis TaxID=419475 RepID=UPI0028B3D198|nr:recombinase family protein [Brucella pseudogrignonensis]MDT6939824.1 recombinase family protein [Brucella pseudogrignonensis]
MVKAYSYIRFSTPEQAKGDSLRRQTAAAEAWCSAHGIQLDDTMRDLGVSAFRGTNRTEGALKHFLALVEEGRISRGSYLIVESLDRISREVATDAAMRLFDLIRAGITVVTLSDGQVYSHDGLRDNWMPLAFSIMIMARAHEESLMKSKRVTAAWERKKELARAEKKPLTPRCPEWLELRDGKFHVRPERVAIVHRIFQDTIDGYGRREIVRRLNAEKVPTWRGGDGWQTSSVAKVVQSKAVIGEYQPHTGTHKLRNRKPVGDPIKDYYPPIVDDVTFWRAQAATEGRQQRSAGRKGKHAHILQGLAVCGACGSPMHLLNKGKPPKGGKYICCSNNLRGLDCSMSRRWRAEMLEDQLLRTFATIEAGSIQLLDNSAPRLEHDISSLKARLDDEKRKRKRLVALVEEGDDDDDLAERYRAISKLIKELTAELKAAEVAQSKATADPDFVQKIIEAASLSAQLDESDQDKARDLRIRLREIIKSTIERIVCEPQIGAILHFPPRHSFELHARNFGIHMKAVRGSGPVFLLDKDPSDEAIDRFFGGPFPDFAEDHPQDYEIQDFDIENPADEQEAFAAAFLKFKRTGIKTPAELAEWVEAYHKENCSS